MKTRKLIFYIIPVVLLNGCATTSDENGTSLSGDIPINQNTTIRQRANEVNADPSPISNISSEEKNKSSNEDKMTIKSGKVTFNPNQTYCTGESNISRMKNGKPPFDVNCEIIKLVSSNDGDNKTIVMAYSESRNHGYDRVQHRWTQSELYHESNAYYSNYWKVIASEYQKHGTQEKIELAGETGDKKTEGTERAVLCPPTGNIAASNEIQPNSIARTRELSFPVTVKPLEFNLPTTVSALTPRLGKYDSVKFLSSEDDRPRGQLFKWSRNDGISFYAINNDYSSITANPYAAVRYIEQDVASEKNATEIFNGFIFNKSTRNDIENASVGYDIDDSEFSGIGGRGKSAIYYNKNGDFTYYFFDGKGLLIGAGRSTLDINQAE
jgi:hypothetical protein